MRGFTIFVAALALALVTSGIVLAPVAWGLLGFNVSMAFDAMYSLSGAQERMKLVWFGFAVGWFMLVLIMWVGFCQILYDKLGREWPS